MSHRALDLVVAWMRARGWEPFDFQREAWESYLRGESGLIHAPTGMGKTLAALLGPVAEARATGATAAPDAASFEPPRILWITPLRALAADTARAIAEPIAELLPHWLVEQRTGDTSASIRRKQKDRLPTVLVTTPESLSLQLSYPEARDRLRTLRCVIIDEWHELLASKRGTQTELCLARLRRWSPSLRTWALSATLGNLDEALASLLGVGPGGQPRPGQTIRGLIPKTIEIETLLPGEFERMPWGGHLGLRGLDRVVEAVSRARTSLLFTNTRSQVEQWFHGLAGALPGWLSAGQLALHHGSLDREERRRVEGGLAAGTLRCVVCTSSLDLGVDFSPVEQVIQVGSPRGIARLLQRAGRSGHRPGAPSRILCVPTNALEVLEFAATREALAAGEIEARTPLAQPLDVLLQHVVTLALGGGFEAAELFEEVRSTRAYRDLAPRDWAWLLDFVTNGGRALSTYSEYKKLVNSDGRFIAPDGRAALLHRMNIGTVTSDSAMSVRFLNGHALGSVEESFVARLRKGDRFLFAGRPLELVQVRDLTAYVRLARGRPNVISRWQGSRMPLSSQLASAVRRLLCADPPPESARAEMTALAPLLALQRQWSHIPAPGELLIERLSTRDTHYLFLYPFAGRLAHEGLGPLLAWRLARLAPLSITASANDYGVQLSSPTPFAPPDDAWPALLDPATLLEELPQCINATELARRQFRDIARVTGLVFASYPGAPRKPRHLQASSSLLFDVFTRYDPENLLLDQARREVFETQFEFRRLRAAMDSARSMRIVSREIPELTPFSFPLWSDRIRQEFVSTERTADRLARMVARLARAAGTPGPPPEPPLPAAPLPPTLEPEPEPTPHKPRRPRRIGALRRTSQ